MAVFFARRRRNTLSRRQYLLCEVEASRPDWGEVRVNLGRDVRSMMVWGEAKTLSLTCGVVDFAIVSKRGTAIEEMLVDLRILDTNCEGQAPIGR